jgi:hypothetical protein
MAVGAGSRAMSATKRRGSPGVGEISILLYFLASYVPQFILHVVSEEALMTRYRIGFGVQYLALFIPGFLLLTFVLHRIIPPISIGYHSIARSIGRLFESRLNTLLALVLLGLAVRFKIEYGINFRHSGPLFSQSDASAILLMFSKPYITAWFVYHIALNARGQHYRYRRAQVQGSLFIAILILSLTSSMDVVPIAWGALFVCAGGGRLRALFVRPGRYRFKIRHAVLVVLGAPVAVGLAVLMVWIGYANKMGAEGTASLIKEVGVGKVAELTMVRTSSSYAAAIVFAEHNLLDFELYEQVWRVPLENVPYRLSLLFDRPLNRPEITAIAQVNYFNYITEAEPAKERAGASPGLVASAFYAAPFPIGFLLIALYAIFVIRVINLPFAAMSGQPRIIAALFAALLTYTLFESPLDYLVFVDPSFSQLFLIPAAFVAASVGRPVRREMTATTTNRFAPSFRSSLPVTPLR